jgi:hypothetical protein
VIRERPPHLLALATRIHAEQLGDAPKLVRHLLARHGVELDHGR